jgi:hypothetical protein
MAQRALQRLPEAHRVDADLALVHDGALVADEELDRILDRHDVAGLGRVDVVDHRGERRRLPGAGRPGDEDEPALLARQLLEHLRQHELLDRLDLERDDAEHGADRAALLEDVHAEPAEAGHAVGEVHLVRLLELLPLELVHDGERHPRDLLRREAAGVLQRNEGPVHAEHGGQAGLEVDVARAGAEGDLQDLVQLHTATSVTPAARRSPITRTPDAG